MSDFDAAAARRTKTSIVTYTLLTAVLSSVFYLSIARASIASGRPGILILGLMWCPGVSGLVTRFIFQGNLRGVGLGWGRTKYHFESYWIPLAYSSVVYLPCWLAGYYDPNNHSLAALLHRFPNLPRAIAPAALFFFLATLGVLGSCIPRSAKNSGGVDFLSRNLPKSLPFHVSRS
jgi:hypothetical protein